MVASTDSLSPSGLNTIDYVPAESATNDILQARFQGQHSKVCFVPELPPPAGAPVSFRPLLGGARAVVARLFSVLSAASRSDAPDYSFPACGKNYPPLQKLQAGRGESAGWGRRRARGHRRWEELPGRYEVGAGRMLVFPCRAGEVSGSEAAQITSSVQDEADEGSTSWTHRSR